MAPRKYVELSAVEHRYGATRRRAEAWRKRRYEAAFVSKLSDAETEAAETQVSAEMAFRCGYWNEETFRHTDEHYDQIMGKLVRMIDNPRPWLIVSSK